MEEMGRLVVLTSESLGRNLLEGIHAQPLPEFSHTLLIAGWAEMTTLAGAFQEVVMAAVFTFHADKPIVQITCLT